MKYLKTYQLFEAKTGLTPDQEEFLNKYTNGTWALNPATGLVDVDGDFYCMWNRLEDFKGVKFGKVTGEFYCHRNELTSLEGAPQEVGGDFSCGQNKLTSLEGAPRVVGGSFLCQDNKLKSLKGAPQEVGKGFHCDAFEISEGDWNLRGWLHLLGSQFSPKASSLVSTLISPEDLNKEIAKDPAGMAMKLKGVWNDESFKETRSKLVWPKGFGEEADLLGDLDDVGF